MNKLVISGIAVALSSCAAIALLPSQNITSLNASAETEEASEAGDTFDDICIWINPSAPSESLIIGTDKTQGLVVFNLEGKKTQFLPDGELNNVDIREGFELNGEKVALVAAGNRSTHTISLYKVDPSSKKLVSLSANTLAAGLKIYGNCLYHSAKTNQFYVFVNAKNGQVIQWKFVDKGEGKIGIEKARELKLNSQVEGCVADDELGFFYIGEEDVGIWKFPAEPNDSTPPILIDHTGTGGHLNADVEGLAIYKTKDNQGYLLASSQGNNSFAIYDRSAGNRFLNRFSIKTPDGAHVVQDTDGIEVTEANLSSVYPKGLMVVQDGYNGGKKQNFKLLAWDKIEALGL